MEAIGDSKTGGHEQKKAFKIWHFPKLDVVINLDYINPKAQYEILDIIKNNPLREEDDSVKDLGFHMSNLLKKIYRLVDGNNRLFFIKEKRDPQPHVDFILHRKNFDPIDNNISSDFNNQARYAMVGISNEIILSKKIKQIVASDAVQKLAKKHGFEGMKFSEPIMALVHKGQRRKYLIYRNEAHASAPLDYEPKDLVFDLRKIFIENNIHPSDLSGRQFITIKEGGKPYIVLIDTEAYTEIAKPVNAR